jgi:phosphoribosylglycinamide formyltransferase-1
VVCDAPVDGEHGTRLVVLVSGSGSNLQALLEHPRLGQLVRLVVADRPDAGGLQLAAEAAVPTVCVAPRDYAERAGWDAALEAAVAGAEPDLVVLAGFQRVLAPTTVSRWPIVNVHPSLLPAFPGPQAVRDALDWGVWVSGATVHFVDEAVDHGPIIEQQPVRVAGGDTVATLHRRIQAVEHELLPACVEAFCDGRIETRGRVVSVRGRGASEHRGDPAATGDEHGGG